MVLTSPSTRSAAVIPVSVANDMGAVQLPNGNTRLFYQEGSDGPIIQIAASNAWNISRFEASDYAAPMVKVLFVDLARITRVEFVLRARYNLILKLHDNPNPNF